MARKRVKRRNILLDMFDAVIELGFKLGALTFVVVLGYLIYGLVSKNGLGGMSTLPQQDRDRVVANVAFSCRILGVSGTILAISTAVRFYVEESLGYMMSLLGVLLYFGAPWAFSILFSQASLMANPAIGMIVNELRLLGVVAFLPGLILIILDIVNRIGQSFADRQRKDTSFLVGKDAERIIEEKFKPRIYARCWQMPYCRDFVRKVCPAYQGRKSCWRLRSGCYCDEKTMLRALGAQSSEGKMFAKEVNYRTGGLLGSKTLTSAQKIQLCRNCVIFQYHQAQKYKLASPLVFPAAAALIWVLYPSIEMLFRSVVKFTDQFMKMVSFLPQASANAPDISQIPEFVFWMFVAWIAIVAVSYGLRFVEFCVFKMQI